MNRQQSRTHVSLRGSGAAGGAGTCNVLGGLYCREVELLVSEVEAYCSISVCPSRRPPPRPRTTATPTSTPEPGHLTAGSKRLHFNTHLQLSVTDGLSVCTLPCRGVH